MKHDTENYLTSEGNNIYVKIELLYQNEEKIIEEISKAGL